MHSSSSSSRKQLAVIHMKRSQQYSFVKKTLLFVTLLLVCSSRSPQKEFIGLNFVQALTNEHTTTSKFQSPQLKHSSNIQQQHENMQDSTSRRNSKRMMLEQEHRHGYDMDFDEKVQYPKCNPCDLDDDDDDDIDMDRREAFFAMLGTVWAVGNLPASWMSIPETANAVYGDDAKLEFPNPLDQISNRSTKACLVESLGTRECMVFADSDNFLYSGANGQILIERLQKSVNALQSIPELTNQKKWSQITGVLTGPMGELIRTMGQLVELSPKQEDGNNNNMQKYVKLVKTDLYAMSAAVDRKQGDIVLLNQEKATKDLFTFLELLQLK